MARPNNDLHHLGALRDHFAEHRLLPSYAEFGQVLGFKGKTGAFKVALRLIEGGYLARAANGKLIPGDRFFELPCLEDRWPAGVSEVTAMSGGTDHHELDRLLVQHPSRTVLVPIRGDSMVDAGVLDGDTAVVERTDCAKSGDFVVALVDGQCTVKELRYEKSKPILMPHNRGLEPIRPQHELKILGVVTGIVRSYQHSRWTRTPGEPT